MLVGRRVDIVGGNLARRSRQIELHAIRAQRLFQALGKSLSRKIEDEKTENTAKSVQYWFDTRKHLNQSQISTQLAVVVSTSSSSTQNTHRELVREIIVFLHAGVGTARCTARARSRKVDGDVTLYGDLFISSYTFIYANCVQCGGRVCERV